MKGLELGYMEIGNKINKNYLGVVSLEIVFKH